jgi:hypothetical protein
LIVSMNFFQKCIETFYNPCLDAEWEERLVSNMSWVLFNILQKKPYLQIEQTESLLGCFLLGI